jgi:hypothetical protein
MQPAKTAGPMAGTMAGMMSIGSNRADDGYYRPSSALAAVKRPRKEPRGRRLSLRAARKTLDRTEYWNLGGALCLATRD